MADGELIDYEVMGAPFGDQTLVARYATGDDDVVRIAAFVIPVGTHAALVEAVLKAVDQNLRPDILRAECERDGRVRWERMGGPLLGPLADLGLGDASVRDTAEGAPPT